MKTTVNHKSVYFALLGVLLLLSGCRSPSHKDVAKATVPPPQQNVTVVAREGRIVDFPCSKCHDKVVPSEMSNDGAKKHKDIALDHYPGMNQCQLCHDPNNMDQLKRITLEPVSFDVSYEICGQCHGEKIRDWKIGAHGKTVGGWMGEAQKLSCAGCHNPHTPRRPKMQALAPPPFPAGGIPKRDYQ